MPWREVSIMEQRREFVRLAMQAGANRRELCRRFEIQPDTGYKWLERWSAGDEQAWRIAHAVRIRVRRRSSDGDRSKGACVCVMPIRPGGRARSRGASSAMGRSRRPSRRCTRSCAGTGVSIRREWLRRDGPTAASSEKRRTICGRWTSRAGSGSATERAAIR